MNLFKQDGPDDVLGAGLQGATQGWQLGKIVALVFIAIGIVLFHILKFVLPLVIRFLAFVLPILWAWLVKLWRWGVKASGSGIAAMKTRLGRNPAS